MGRTRPLTQYGSIGLLVIFLAAAIATVVTSCGGGGGDDSTGALCDQCGVTDGACQDRAFVFPGSGVRDAVPCPTGDNGDLNGCIPVGLLCRRQSDSAQQRCYPLPQTTPPSNANPDFDFRCDGSRPGGTVLPPPTATVSVTPTPGPAKTNDPNAVCGDGTIEGLEDCEGTNLGGKTCGNVCDAPGGVLSCGINCRFVFTGCTGDNCSSQ